MDKQLSEVSKFLSYVLRHQPEAIGITLDLEGWTDIPVLIAAAANAGTQFDLDLVKTVVATSDKKRFAISEDGLRIRAVQGHSTGSVKISHIEKMPPELLYHGTATRFLDSIKKNGLQSGERQHVHLSQDSQTATAVGKRHGNPIVLTVAAGVMHQQGLKFYQADNGVWLTEKVPACFISG